MVLAAAAAATATSNNNSGNRRLVLTIYRSLQRFCNSLPPTTPLDEFVPPISGAVIDDVTVLRKALKKEFRKPIEVGGFHIESPLANQQQQRVQKAMQGMRQLNELREDIMAYSEGRRQEQGKSEQQQQRQEQEQQQSAMVGNDKNTAIDVDVSTSAAAATTMNEVDWVQQQIDTVQWLPKLEDSPPPQSLVDNDDEDVKLPLFPLQSPLFHKGVLSTGKELLEDGKNDENNKGDDSLTPLPLFTTPQPSIFPGMEVGIRIFEPRYRQLYSDLRKQPAQLRNFVVPFAHPFEEGKFSQLGLVHLVTQIKEVADETGGKIQYVADHVATKPVWIQQILNPQVWDTKETYLHARVRYLDDDDEDHHQHPNYREGMSTSVHKSSLEEYLENLNHPIASKSLEAFRGEGFWTFVDVWNTYFEQELAQLQLGVSIRAKLEAGGMSDTNMNVLQLGSRGGTSSNDISPDVVNAVQQPYRARLLQLMMNTSLLVPTLLSLDGEGKCQHMIRVIEQELQQQQK